MKRAFAVLCAMLALVVATAADENVKLTAQDIINKHLEAVGGKEALAKFKTRVALGTVKREGNPDEDFAIMSEAPNRLSARYVFKQADWQLTYDGTKSIHRPQFPRSLADIEEKLHEMLSSGLMFNSISLYSLLSEDDRSDVKMEAKGTKKIAGRNAYVVEVKQGKLPKMRLYFDAENFMWVRTDYGSVTKREQMRTFTNDVQNKGVENATIDFYVETSDFREVDGIKLPFKFVQVITQPFVNKTHSAMIGTIKEYRHNVQIDPAMFR
jgi:outer membrane lipoprotein-sorting protein